MNKFLNGGVAALVIGVVLVIAAILIGTLIPPAVDRGIEDALPVTKAEPEKESYQKWLNTNNEDATPLYREFTFFNLTNAAEVASSGAKPNYESVGPYVYRKYQEKRDVQFHDDGTEVSFVTVNSYFFQADRSGAGLNPLTDMITNINPSYLGVLKKTQSEEILSLNFVGPSFAGVMQSMTKGYPFGAIEKFMNEYIAQAYNDAITAIVTVDGVPPQLAALKFFEIFANSTVDYPEYNINSSLRLSTTTSTGMSVNVIGALFTPTVPLSFLQNTSYVLWAGADIFNSSVAKNLIMSAGISDVQLATISAWRGRLMNGVVAPATFQKYQVASFEELGMKQWGEGDITQVDLQLLQLPFSPEFALFASSKLGYTGGIPLSTVKLLTSGPTNITGSMSMLGFLTLVQSQSFTQLNQIYQLSPQQAGALAGYFTGLLQVQLADTQLNSVFKQGGGLFRSQTVDAWLWSGSDPLLKMLNPASYASNLFGNSSAGLPDRFKTGKNNITAIGEYVLYANASTVDVWRVPEPAGGTAATQFHPKLDKKEDETIVIWVSDLLRRVYMTYYETVDDLFGIKMFRYRMDDINLATSEKFYQTIVGLGNMTSAYSGVPIFLSKPNFFDADPSVLTKITGVSAGTWQENDIYIDVEPRTGATMRAHKRLQLNAYVDSSYDLVFNRFNKNTTVDLFYPIVWIDENSQLGEDTANDFKHAIYRPLEASKITMGVVLAVGIAVIIAGAVLVFVGLKRRASMQDENNEMQMSPVK